MTTTKLPEGWERRQGTMAEIYERRDKALVRWRPSRFYRAPGTWKFSEFPPDEMPKDPVSAMLALNKQYPMEVEGDGKT